LREDLLHELSAIARDSRPRLARLNVSPEQRLLLAQMSIGKTPQDPSVVVLGALPNYMDKSRPLILKAEAERKAIDEAEKGALSSQNRSALSNDALKVIDIGRTLETNAKELGAARLLAVVRAYPGTRASVRALEALPFAVQPKAEVHLSAGAVKVPDRGTIRSFMIAIQDPDRALDGLNAARYIMTDAEKDPTLRRDFIEALLAEWVLQGNSERARSIRQLLSAMSSSYPQELLDLSGVSDASKKPSDPNKKADDPKVARAAYNFAPVLHGEIHNRQPPARLIALSLSA